MGLSRKVEVRSRFRAIYIVNVLAGQCWPVLTTYEMKNWSQISSLFARRSGAREEFEVKDERKALAAFGGRPKGDP
jgi:hypothetical protein